jgi:hypothetical protein
MNKCPCEECLVFAICNQKTEIDCEILYRFICNTGNGKFEGFKQGVGIPVFNLFNKYIMGTYYISYSIHLTEYGERNSILYDE